MTFTPFLARKIIVGNSMTQWTQTSPDEYEVAHFKRQRGPWGRGWVWMLDGERVTKKGRAPRDIKPHAKPVPVATAASISAETAPPGREEPWRERQRADEEAYWDRKTRNGET